MDNVKLILVLIVLLMECVACAKKGKPEECDAYPSAYEVEFPDASIRKAGIAACGSDLVATALDETRDSFRAPSLVIQLKDIQTGMTYLTPFDGQ